MEGIDSESIEMDSVWLEHNTPFPQDRKPANSAQWEKFSLCQIDLVTWSNDSAVDMGIYQHWLPCC